MCVISIGQQCSSFHTVKHLKLQILRSFLLVRSRSYSAKVRRDTSVEIDGTGCNSAEFLLKYGLAVWVSWDRVNAFPEHFCLIFILPIPVLCCLRAPRYRGSLIALTFVGGVTLIAPSFTSRCMSLVCFRCILQN